MAIINKTGITDGGTIQAEHVTRAIDALSGGSTDTVVATGSFSGSLTGIATSASFASTASFALNAGAGAGFPFTGSARITGSLLVTGSFEVSRSFSASTASISMRTGTVSVISNATTITSPVTINGTTTINGSALMYGGLFVDPGNSTSFRNSTVLLDNSSSFTASLADYDVGTIFIVDRTVGNQNVMFDLGIYDASQYGSTYKIIFPYTGLGRCSFIDNGNSTIYGVYSDSSYSAKQIAGVSVFEMNDPDHAVVEATAVKDDGETWFLQIQSYGAI